MDPFSRGILLLLVAVLGPASSLFVPEQLPTLLSFVYTNIPPIRKGIDSRVGFGFRLGPNADVQVLLELGPQQNTAPIGPQKADANSKREANIPTYKYRPNKYRAPVNGNWLQAWKQQQAMVEDDEDIGVMPAQPAMDKDVIAHLQQLYKEQPMDRDGRNAKTVKESAPINQGRNAEEKEEIEKVIEVIVPKERKDVETVVIQNVSDQGNDERREDSVNSGQLNVVAMVPDNA